MWQSHTNQADIVRVTIAFAIIVVFFILVGTFMPNHPPIYKDQDQIDYLEKEKVELQEELDNTVCYHYSFWDAPLGNKSDPPCPKDYLESQIETINNRLSELKALYNLKE